MTTIGSPITMMPQPMQNVVTSFPATCSSQTHHFVSTKSSLLVQKHHSEYKRTVIG